MENAVIALISIAIILGGTLTLVLGSIPVIDTLTNSSKQMEQLAGEMRRTEITTDNCTISSGGAQVVITVRNNGELSLADFASWDVIVRYYSDNTSCSSEWLPYTSSNPPENNKWTVDGIYFGSSAETIEPNILNPGENMNVLMRLDPAVAVGTTNWATISTPNGVATQAIFRR